MELLLLCAATSADIFAAAFGLGAGGIKLPLRSAAAVAFSGAAALGLSVLIASAADSVIPMDGALWVSRAILIIMGLCAIFGDKKQNKKPCPYDYAQVVNRPDISDADRSRTVSAAEAAALAVALSADAAITGIGAGIGGMNALPVFFCSLAMGFAASALGTLLGKKLSGHKNIRSGVPSGIVLIILAFLL